MFIEVGISCRFLYLLLVIYMFVSCGELITTRELIFLLSFTCNYVVSIRWGFLLHLVLGIGCVIFTVALPMPSI